MIAMNEKEDFYILFPNYTEGLKLEKVLKNNSIKYVISPTPRKLSSFCGISIKYSKKDKEKIEKLVDINNINIEGFFVVQEEKKNFYGI